MQRLSIEMEPRMAFAIDTVIAVKVFFDRPNALWAQEWISAVGAKTAHLTPGSPAKTA
jgi:hypothetical protein